MDGLAPPVMQRAKGQIDFHKDGQTVKQLYQSGCSKLILPKTYGKMTEAVMLNTAGGITGGDRLDISIVAEFCDIVVTSQTAERLYKSSTDAAIMAVNLRADNAACLHWLPQETIMFDGAELDRTIRLDMSADSKCLLAETIILGREAMGETIHHCHFTDNWRLYRDGTLFHAESAWLNADIADVMAASAGGNGAKSLTTILYAGSDAEQLAGNVRAIIDDSPSFIAASCWNEKFIIRLASASVAHARLEINRLLCALRQQPMPRVWQV